MQVIVNIFFLLFLSIPIFGTLQCRPEGPILPKPTGLASSSIFNATAHNLAKTLDDAVSGKIKAGWEVQNLSFSVAVVSLDQKDAGVPIWEYHHRAVNNIRGTNTIDRDSQYLIGSISKVITDYLLLRTGIDLETPVTDFLPQLRDSKSRIPWHILTLGMLSSQLAGTPANDGFSEYYYLQNVFIAKGFPNISVSTYPTCGVVALNKACSEQEFLAGLKHMYPTTAPMERLAYSSLAFNVLTLALQAKTGKTYRQLLSKYLPNELGMNSTYPSPGDDTRAVIPPGDNGWGTDYGYGAPTGGLVSSIADLSRFTHSILSRSMGLSPSQVRQWLKPDAFAGGSQSFTGRPWEIFRPDNLVADHIHPVTIYGKNGGAQQYRSQISIADEYGIAIIVLTAGPMQAQGLLTDAMLATFVPIVDKIGRLQVDKNYAQTFKSTSLNCTSTSQTNINTNITFKLDQDSLIISSFYRNGSDIKTALPQLWNMTFGQYNAPFGSELRLFSTELFTDTSINGQKLKGEVWRLWPEVLSSARTDLPGMGLSNSDCLTWTVGDWVYYGGEPTDRVIFYKDVQGKVVGFEAPFIRSGILVSRAN